MKLNVPCAAVRKIRSYRYYTPDLIKSGHPWMDRISGDDSLARMRQLNPAADGSERPLGKLCNGQTLLCRSMGLKVPDWDAQRFDPQRLFVDDIAEQPSLVIQAARLGIPHGRDEHLQYRFVDAAFANFCTRNPLRRGQVEGLDYHLLGTQDDSRR